MPRDRNTQNLNAYPSAFLEIFQAAAQEPQTLKFATRRETRALIHKLNRFRRLLIKESHPLAPLASMVTLRLTQAPGLGPDDPATLEAFTGANAELAEKIRSQLKLLDEFPQKF